MAQKDQSAHIGNILSHVCSEIRESVRPCACVRGNMCAGTHPNVFGSASGGGCSPLQCLRACELTEAVK